MDDNKVAILLEDLMVKFNTFGEGLEGLRDEMNNRFNTVEQKLDNHIDENRHESIQNRQDHQQLMQMVKELDIEVVKMKRIK